MTQRRRKKEMIRKVRSVGSCRHRSLCIFCTEVERLLTRLRRKMTELDASFSSSFLSMLMMLTSVSAVRVWVKVLKSPKSLLLYDFPFHRWREPHLVLAFGIRVDEISHQSRVWTCTGIGANQRPLYVKKYAVNFSLQSVRRCWYSLHFNPS